MTSIKDSGEIEAILAEYIPGADNKPDKDMAVERMKQLMAKVDNPQDKLAIIHIAGTSGKTSSAHYIAKLLQLSGRRVGLTVSPHVDDVVERIQINGWPLTRVEFKAALERFLKKLKTSGIQPTYFEILAGFAIWYFAEAGVDYAVIETGIGGLYDCTNVADRPDKLCVITDIGIDHTNLLGNTLSDIARQKAGIIHPGNMAIAMRQDKDILEVLTGWCQDNNAEICVVDGNAESVGLDFLPQFQKRNWQLALAAYEYLQARDGLARLDDENLRIAVSTKIPGRMDEIQVADKTIIMDGAHNEQKMQAFVASFQKRYPSERVPVLLSLKQGKSAEGVLKLLLPVTSELIITEYQQDQGLPVPPQNVHELAELAHKIGFNRIEVEQDCRRAYELLVGIGANLAVITGSFYLIGQLRQIYKELR